MNLSSVVPTGSKEKQDAGVAPPGLRAYPRSPVAMSDSPGHTDSAPDQEPVSLTLHPSASAPWELCGHSPGMWATKCPTFSAREIPQRGAQLLAALLCCFVWTSSRFPPFRSHFFHFLILLPSIDSPEKTTCTQVLVLGSISEETHIKADATRHKGPDLILQHECWFRSK